MLPDKPLMPATIPPVKAVRNMARDGVRPPRILPMSVAVVYSAPKSTQYALNAHTIKTVRKAAENEISFPVLKYQVNANATTAMIHQGRNICNNNTERKIDKESLAGIIFLDLIGDFVFLLNSGHRVIG